MQAYQYARARAGALGLLAMLVGCSNAVIDTTVARLNSASSVNSDRKQSPSVSPFVISDVSSGNACHGDQLHALSLVSLLGVESLLASGGGTCDNLSRWHTWTISMSPTSSELVDVRSNATNSLEHVALTSAIGPDGNAYTGGTASGLANLSLATIRYFNPDDPNAENLPGSLFQFALGKPAYYPAIAFRNNRLYAAVAGRGRDNSWRWGVRAKTPSIWIEQESEGGFQYEAGQDSYPTALLVTRTQSIYVGGTGTKAIRNGTEGHWLIRRQTGEGSFVTIDDYVDPGAFHTQVGGARFGAEESYLLHGQSALAEDEITRSVFAVGYSLSSAGSTWLVRRVNRSGPNAVEIDRYRGPTGEGARAVSVLSNQLGLFVAGFARMNNQERWIVRHSPDQGVTWSTIDNFLPGDRQLARATSLAAGRDGTVYVGGYIVQTDRWSERRWLIRKIRPSAP